MTIACIAMSHMAAAHDVRARTAAGGDGAKPSADAPLASERMNSLIVVPGFPNVVIVSGDTLPPSRAARIARWDGQRMNNIPGTPAAAPDSVAITGTCLRLDAAVPPGDYRIELDVVGMDHPTGPLDVVAADSTIAADLVVEGHRRQRLEVDVRSRSEPLRILLRPYVDALAAVARVRIAPIGDGADRLRVDSLAAAAPAGSGALPGGGAASDVEEDPRRVLASICDLLVQSQLSTGQFAYETNAWWQTSFAVRALLAGYEILGEDRYLQAAWSAVSAFAGEQADDGGWCAYYLGHDPNAAAAAAAAPTSTGTPPSPPATAPAPAGAPSPSCDTRNVADLGTMTTCLSMMASRVSPDEARVYVDAHRAYVDRFASRRAQPSGAYSNGLFQGKIEHAPYSVATATQAMTLASLFEMTGDTSYVAAAERAARFLLSDIGEDGAFLFHPDNRPDPLPIAATQFGDVYYILDALLWVERATGDRALRESIRSALHDYLYGAKGLLAQLPPGDWFPPSDPWSTGKINGMLGILAELRSILGPEARLDRVIAAGTRALCTPSLEERYFVLDPPCPGESRMAATCTAFAGLSIARCLEPGISFHVTRPSPPTPH